MVNSNSESNSCPLSDKRINSVSGRENRGFTLTFLGITKGLLLSRYSANFSGIILTELNKRCRRLSQETKDYYGCSLVPLKRKITLDFVVLPEEGRQTDEWGRRKEGSVRCNDNRRGLCYGRPYSSGTSLGRTRYPFLLKTRHTRLQTVTDGHIKEPLPNLSSF